MVCLGSSGICIFSLMDTMHQQYMKEAYKEALLALKIDEVPVGAVVVCQNRIIGRGHNLTERLNDVTAHAEMQAFTAAANFLGGKYLSECTLYVTLEPCVMCAGTLYWANIGRLVFGATEKRLLELTGNNQANPTLDIPCRYVFEHGQKTIKVWGPFPELEKEFIELHKGFWK